MPELPDIDVYVESIGQTIRNAPLNELRIGNPFLVRSVTPSPADLADRMLTTTRRIGKRIALGFEGDLWAVVHLMIAGRLQWEEKKPALGSKSNLASFDFEHGSLLLTEAGTKKRASLHIVASGAGLAEHNPGGIEPLQCSLREFREALTFANHTLKRALTDPRILSGIGNAYSDEILHAAKLSPVLLTQRLGKGQIEQLFDATRATLRIWRERLLTESGGCIPRKVTAFRPDMAVHGKHGKACPDCNEPVQRIRYKSNETNYCARCQNDGRLLKDRSLSRLLKEDWPKTLDDL